MATEQQVKESLNLGIEYLARLSRRIRRSDGTLQLPPMTDFAISHDSPGVSLTRIIPRNNGQVQAGPETVDTTGGTLPVLKMQGDPVDDFEYLIIGMDGLGGVTNISTSGPTLDGDSWSFEQTGDYAFRGRESEPPILHVGDDSVWSVKYETRWSNSGGFPPSFKISVKKLSGPRVGDEITESPIDGVLAWDNFAAIPETTEQYTVVVDQTGEEPIYRSPTSFHTTRYHKNLAMANRHLALYSGSPIIRETLPYLENFWQQFSKIPGLLALDPNDRVIGEDLYDGLWGWGGNRETPDYSRNEVIIADPGISQFPPWLISADTFYDPQLHPRLLPLDVARAPYQSHAVGSVGNYGYRTQIWRRSPQLRAHTALHLLWALGDTESAWLWLNTISWDGRGIRNTGYPGRGGGTSVDAYKGNWLAIWLCAVTLLEAYLRKTEDPNGRLPQVEEWADQAAAAVIQAQVPANGVFEDNTHGTLCQPEHAGGVFNGYETVDDSHLKSKGWHSWLFGIAEWLGSRLGLFDRDNTQMPHHFNTPTSYEPTYWSMVGLTYYLGNRFATGNGNVVVNRQPVADAGSDQTVHLGATVALDASGSSDSDAGDTLTYAWTQIAGPTVSLSDATDASPTFTAPDATVDLTFRLTVEDSQGDSDSDTVTTTVRDLTPAALGNLDAAVGDGYAELSWDDPSDSSITSYQHRTQEAGSQWGVWTTIPQSGATTTSYRKTGLTNVTEHWFEIRAVNEHGPGSSAQVGPVTPTAPASQPTNRRPSANAGPNQIVNRDEVVTLDGTASRDRGGSGTISHSWRQTQGPRVSLTGADTARPTFTAPSSPTYLRFRLTVTDSHGVTDIDAVVVRVTDSPDSAAVSNLPPVANAGPDQTVTPGGEVALDGSGSLDPDSGDTLSYVWRQTVGPSVVLSSTTVVNPTFTAPSSPTTLRFRLTVTDSYGAIDIDAVVITVQ